jgi:hypothetical protein
MLPVFRAASEVTDEPRLSRPMQMTTPARRGSVLSLD